MGGLRETIELTQERGMKMVERLLTPEEVAKKLAVSETGEAKGDQSRKAMEDQGVGSGGVPENGRIPSPQELLEKPDRGVFEAR